jgi:hypothetical protein
MAVMQTRRNFSSFLAALATAFGASMSVAQAQPNYSPPDETLLEGGDFIFPKKPGDYIPYIDRGEQLSTFTEDEAEWNEGKRKFLATVKEKFPYLSDQDIEAIRRLSFAEFYAAYAGSVVSNEPHLQRGFSLYVGHVGIIQVNGGKKWVIEALGGKGVIKQSYGDWLSGRPNALVWVGRLKDPPLDSRIKVSHEAAKYIGRDYDFWNFDLDDDRAFYCSKLVWMAVFRSLGFAVDGNTNPKRKIWFSPKQLLYAGAIKRIIEPEEQYIVR